MAYSLSDGGNVGRFTCDGATPPLYDEILARSLGDTLGPSSQGGSADSDGLYIHWIGGNDLAAAALAPTPFAARQIVDSSASAAVSQVSRLLDAGAGAVIMPTVPNVGATPALLQALQRGYHRLTLASTPNAVSFYQQHGFRPLGESRYPSTLAGCALRCMKMAIDL